MGTPATDLAHEAIKRTLSHLADGWGYKVNVTRLLDAPMSELFPPSWTHVERAAACDELIRKHVYEISAHNYVAATIAALDLNDEYNLSTQRARLIAFRRRWRDEHEDDNTRLDITKDEATYQATRKWWEEGGRSLTNLIHAEIERRNRAGAWPNPSPESLDRIQAAIRLREQQNGKAATQVEQIQQPTEPHRAGERQRNRLRRPLIWVCSILVVLLVFGVWLLHGGYHFLWVWQYRTTSAARCSDIGDRDRNTPEPIWSGPFRAAYKQAGGVPRIGCPRTDDPSGYVHQWAAGESQDLQGGHVGIARIMALSPQHVIVMAGPYYRDYTDQGNGQSNPDAAQQKGYPTSNPVPCGPARLVLLKQSQEGESPGAMVTDARNAHFIWLPKLIWMRYRATGGPFGRLSLPVGGEQSTPTGQLQRFQHGYILLTQGVARTNLEQAGHIEPANPHAVASLAECIALTRK